MKIPKSIKIGSYTYKVRVCQHLSCDGVEVCGTCDSCKQIISLNKNMPKANLESSLIHELLEAIIAINDIKMTHQTLCTLESCLYQILKDNNLLKE